MQVIRLLQKSDLLIAFWVIEALCLANCLLSARNWSRMRSLLSPLQLCTAAWESWASAEGSGSLWAWFATWPTSPLYALTCIAWMFKSSILFNNVPKPQSLLLETYSVAFSRGYVTIYTYREVRQLIQPIRLCSLTVSWFEQGAWISASSKLTLCKEDSSNYVPTQLPRFATLRRSACGFHRASKLYPPLQTSWTIHWVV